MTSTVRSILRYVIPLITVAIAIRWYFFREGGDEALLAFIGGLTSFAVSFLGAEKEAMGGAKVGWGEWFVGPKKRYFKLIYYRHRNFDVKGLTTQGIYTLALRHVFVELSLVPTPAHQTSADPLRLPEALQTGRHTIWAYLRGGSEQNFALIGAPGSGKTTLLKHIALVLASGRKVRRKLNAPDKVPILLFLRDHALTIRDEEKTFTLADSVKDKFPPFVAHWLQQQLGRGNCLVLLDGLDEVADATTRKQVVTWVEAQIEAYSDNQFVITSRPFGYQSNPVQGVMVAEVRPFSNKQQRQFIDNWYRANEIMSQQRDDEGVRDDAQQGADDLWRRLQSTATLAQLAVNPLLLTMIATVHRYRSSLPGRRVELYAEICEVFLGKRQQARGLQLDLTPAQRQRVLQPLAWQMMANERREISASEARAVIAPTLRLVDLSASTEQFLKMIENASGLLIERESGVYAFSHLTFQEYLAAVHVQEEQLEAHLLPQVGASWWRETILLVAARGDATPFIEACLQEGSVETLTLAVDCAEEGRESDPAVVAQLNELLEAGLEADDPARRKLAAEVKLARRLRDMVRVSETVAIDTTLVSHAEYQLFSDEMREQGKYHQPDHWHTYRFPAGQGKLPVVGVRPSDAKAFCEWLNTRTENEQYRLLDEDEVGLVDVKNIAVDVAGYWFEANGNLVVEIAKGDNPTISRKMLEDYRNRARSVAHEPIMTGIHTFRDPLTSELHLDHDLNLDLVLSPNFARTDIAHIPLRYSERNPSLALCLDRPLDLTINIDHCRAIALIAADDFYLVWYLTEMKQSWRVSRQSDYGEWKLEMQRLTDTYLKVFVDLCILEERRKGNLPAFEGIRIARERVAV